MKAKFNLHIYTKKETVPDSLIIDIIFVNDSVLMAYKVRIQRMCLRQMHDKKDLHVRVFTLHIHNLFYSI